MSKTSVIWLVACIAAIALIIWGAVALAPAAPPTPTTTADPSLLPGISQDTPAPGAAWALETEHLKERLAADSMQPQTMEGEVLHIHQHLNLFVHGKEVSVPKDIGINEKEGWLASVHVHDDTGIIHVESPIRATYTLGQFFDIWGVYFTKDCVGGYCADDTNRLTVYVNGEPYAGDPRTLALEAHQEIVVAYGTAAEAPATIPASYTFPAGY